VSSDLLQWHSFQVRPARRTITEPRAGTLLAEAAYDAAEIDNLLAGTAQQS